MIGIKENDIRPEALFKRYRELAEEDAKTFFSQVPRHRIPCPACGAFSSTLSFDKLGFQYEVCQICETLYANPRPEAAAFTRYYQDAPSVRFWATDFYKQTEAVRRETVFKPKVAQVLNILERFLPGTSPSCIADIGAGYGIFCEEMQRAAPTVPVIAIEPGLSLAKVCQEKGLKVVHKFLEEMTSDELPPTFGFRVATCFELIEHPCDPFDFLQSARRILGPQGILILTTLNIKGFDLQLLWEHSNTIHPPYHINFFSTNSIDTLMNRAGFEVLSIETPGRLDVDIVAKQLTHVQNRFLRSLLLGDDMLRQNLQAFLRDNLLSSHMLVVARSKR
jgi:2-polyprenyl-3-methyl-5-hydroxy-6-metoxy-1,4-benzoquinol methylase